MVMNGEKITLYALDCGTVNWRLYRMEYHFEGEKARHVTSPLSSPLANFSDTKLPAVMLLNPAGTDVESVGETALGYQEDHQARGRLREFFKPAIGSHLLDKSDPRQYRYSHFEALLFTRLLLKTLIEQIRVEKYNNEEFDDRIHFSIAYPDRWRMENDGKVFEDYYHVILECFPPDLAEQVHFVPESEGVILGLRDQDLLNSFHPKDLNLIIDVGASKTAFYARKFNYETGKLVNINQYEEPFGGGLYDTLLAQHLSEMLEIPPDLLASDPSAFMVLRLKSQQIKESLSMQAEEDTKALDSLSALNALTLAMGNEQVFRTQVDLTLKEFNQLSHPLDEAFLEVLDRGLESMDIDDESIGKVILLGGGINIPGILTNIQEHFGKNRVIFPENPQEMIVRGIGLAFTDSLPERELEEQKYIPVKKSGWQLLDENGDTIDIKKEIMIAGRSPESDIQLSSPKCSRTHALIRLEGNALTLIDLRSKNGTYVNKVQLAPNAGKSLRDGDEIKFGDQIFILE
jgi:hypothetical protein